MKVDYAIRAFNRSRPIPSVAVGREFPFPQDFCGNPHGDPHVDLHMDIHMGIPTGENHIPILNPDSWVWESIWGYQYGYPYGDSHTHGNPAAIPKGS